jgi:hypothetical protein
MCTLNRATRVARRWRYRVPIASNPSGNPSCIPSTPLRNSAPLGAMPLPAIIISFDAPTALPSNDCGTERRSALRGYADVLRGAGFSVQIGTYYVKASVTAGPTPSICILVDGRVFLEPMHGARLSGRLTPHGWRPCTNGALDAAHQWILEKSTPSHWVESPRSPSAQDWAAWHAAAHDQSATDFALRR